MLITGGNGGLGLALSNRLLNKGARVVSVDLKPDLSPTLGQSVRYLSNAVLSQADGRYSYVCDIGDPVKLRQVAARIRKEVRVFNEPCE